MQKIHKQSNGWPGKINQLAHNLLVESAPTDAPNAISKSTFNTTRAISAVIGVTVISALLFFQNDFNTWISDEANNTSDAVQSSTTEQPLEIPPKKQLAASSTTNPPAIKDSTALNAPQNPPVGEPAVILAQMHSDNKPNDDTEAALKAVDQIPENESAPDFATPTEIAKDQTNTISAAINKAPSSTSAIPNETKAAEPKIIDLAHSAKTTEKITAPPIVTSPTQIPSKTQPSHAPTIIPTDLPGHRADWILSRNSEHYTLQLVAGNNIKTLRDFIQQHTLTAPLAVYQSTRKGKPWFGLIHGTFPNKQQAINARSRLSKTLRRVKPWVRELAPLQKELRETGLRR